MIKIQETYCINGHNVALTFPAKTPLSPLNYEVYSWGALFKGSGSFRRKSDAIKYLKELENVYILK